MKKIFYLMVIVAVTFSACQKQPIISTGGYTKTIAITLGASDYTSLGKSVYSYYTKNFNSDADAKTYIPTILNSEYPQLDNGSKANVTFSEQLVQTDSVYKDLTYALVTTPTNDYTLLPGNKFSDFSISQLLAWMPYKYPSPVANQQAILTFAYYNGQTTATATFAVAYINNAWQQIYLLTPAQYTSVGHPAYSQFTSADDANIPSYINAILKADPSVMATAKVGTMQYVSFNYYSSAKVTSQRILTFAYNGTNWITTATNTLAFIKSGGTWIPDPTVYYTLNSADTKLIGNPNGTNNTTIGTSAQRANLYQYGDFETSWTTADLDNAMILVLTTDFPTPKVNVNYVVTYLSYTGGTDVPTNLIFVYNGTTWVPQQ